MEYSTVYGTLSNGRDINIDVYRARIWKKFPSHQICKILSEGFCSWCWVKAMNNKTHILINHMTDISYHNYDIYFNYLSAPAAKSLQSCPTLCNPIDSSPPGSPVPGILQARTLEWVAISFSNAWKWKPKVKSVSRVRPSATPWTTAHSLLCPGDFPGKSTGVGCHCLLRYNHYPFL